MSKRIICLPDSGLASGFGHISRQATLLSNLLAGGYDAELVLNEQLRTEPWLMNWLNEKVQCKFLRFLSNEVIDDGSFIKNSLVILDTYAELSESLSDRSAAGQVILVDDLAYQRLATSNYQMVIPNFCSALQKSEIEHWNGVSAQGRIHYGGDYIIVDENFRLNNYRKQEISRKRLSRLSSNLDEKNVLIGFGGGFDSNSEFTLTRLNSLIEMLTKTFSGLNITCFGHVNDVSVNALGKRVSFKGHIGQKELSYLLQRSDFYIGSVGYSMWERASLLVPSIVFSMAANQYPYIKVGEELGIHVSLDAVLESSIADITGVLIDCVENAKSMCFSTAGFEKLIFSMSD